MEDVEKKGEKGKMTPNSTSPTPTPSITTTTAAFDGSKMEKSQNEKVVFSDTEKRMTFEPQSSGAATNMNSSTNITSVSTTNLDINTSTEKPQHRPDPTREDTSASVLSNARKQLPALKRRETKLAQKEAHPWEHLGITLGLPMIALFDLIIPCIIYYVWWRKQVAAHKSSCSSEYPNLPYSSCPIPQPEQFNSDILGSAIACFGIGELWILLARVWRLFYHRDECAPLLSRNKYELDATSWVYLVAMIVALIPFTVGSTMVIPKLYLYGPSFLMGFLGILMTVTTLHPFKIPIGINSHARGSGLRPFIYYAAEDFIAVDGLQDREFRIRYNERYESNPMFRRFFFNLTLWWMLGVCVYIGCVSAVIWTVEFHIAFGLSLGILFAYIACWAGCTVLWVNFEMKREHRAYEEGKIGV